MRQEAVDNICERVDIDLDGASRLPILPPDCRMQRVDDVYDSRSGSPQGQEEIRSALQLTIRLAPRSWHPATLLVIVTGAGEVVAEHILVPPGEAPVRDEHYGGPRPMPRRAVRPTTAAEKQFCAL